MPVLVLGRRIAEGFKPLYSLPAERIQPMRPLETVEVLTINRDRCRCRFHDPVERAIGRDVATSGCSPLERAAFDTVLTRACIQYDLTQATAPAPAVSWIQS